MPLRLKKIMGFLDQNKATKIKKETMVALSGSGVYLLPPEPCDYCKLCLVDIFMYPNI